MEKSFFQQTLFMYFIYLFLFSYSSRENNQHFDHIFISPFRECSLPFVAYAIHNANDSSVLFSQKKNACILLFILRLRVNKYFSVRPVHIMCERVCVHSAKQIQLINLPRG